jgi:hypothetical protein
MGCPHNFVPHGDIYRLPRHRERLNFLVFLGVRQLETEGHVTRRAVSSVGRLYAPYRLGCGRVRSC